MLLQQVTEILIAKVMKNAGRDENCRRLFESKSICDRKLATKVLDRGQPLRFIKQRDIEIDTHQLDVVAKRSARREPTNHETGAAADVDDANWIPHAAAS